MTMRPVLLIVMFCFALSSPACFSCAHPLTVHIDLDAPSSFRNSKNELLGMDVDMLMAVAKEINCPLRWHTEEMSGARVLRSIEQGQLDAIIRASVTPERQRYAYFSDAYRDEVLGV